MPEDEQVVLEIVAGLRLGGILENRAERVEDQLLVEVLLWRGGANRDVIPPVLRGADAQAAELGIERDERSRLGVDGDDVGLAEFAGESFELRLGCDGAILARLSRDNGPGSF